MLSQFICRRTFAGYGNSRAREMKREPRLMLSAALFNARHNVTYSAFAELLGHARDAPKKSGERSVMNKEIILVRHLSLAAFSLPLLTDDDVCGVSALHPSSVARRTAARSERPAAVARPAARYITQSSPYHDNRR